MPKRWLSELVNGHFGRLNKICQVKFFKVSMQEMTISCDGDTWTIFTSTTLKNMTKTFKVVPQQNRYLCEWAFDQVLKMTCLIILVLDTHY